MILVSDSQDRLGWRPLKQDVEHYGGRVWSVFPPQVLVVDIDPAIAAEWVRSGKLRAATQEPLSPPTGLSRAAQAGVAHWNYALEAKRTGKTVAPAEEVDPSDLAAEREGRRARPNDVFLPPDIPLALLEQYASVGFRTPEDEAAARAPTNGALRGGVTSVGPLAYYTSAYMLGEIVVGVIMPESNGLINPNIEDWTAAEMTQDRNWIITGMNRFAADCPSANVTIIYHFDEAPGHGGIAGTIDCDYEGVTNSSAAVTNALSRLSYTGSPGTRDYANHLCNLYDADWAYFIYVVDNTVTISGRAWAFLGGPYTQVYSRSCGDLLIEHESGHIFNAMDEYHPDAARSPIGRWGYLQIVNANSQYNDGKGFNGGAGEGLQALMLNNFPEHSAFSTGQIGWYDSDGDGILDVSDSYPTVTLQLGGAAGGAASFSGQANVAPVRSQADGFNVGLSVNEIAGVEWRVAGHAWQPAAAADGTFDTGIEDFTFTTPALPDGTYTIEGRATNNLGVSTLLPTRTSLVVSGSSATDAAPFARFRFFSPVQQVGYWVNVDAEESTDLETPTAALQVRWDWTNDGNWDTSFTTAHVDGHIYPDTGLKTVALQVRDAAGNTSVARGAVLIVDENAAPIAKLQSSAGYLQGTFSPTFTFDAGGSFDPEGASLYYDWDWDGNGTFDEYGTGPVVNHTYTLPTTAGGKSDTWTVICRVWDDWGNSADVTREIWACPYNHYPQLGVSVNPLVAATDTTVIFDTSATTDPDLSTTWDGLLEYRFDYDGDGNWDTDMLPGRYFFHNYPQVGTYATRIQTRDRFNALDEEVVTIQVGTDPVEQPFFVTGGSMSQMFTYVMPHHPYQFNLTLQYLGTPGDLSAIWYVDNIEGGSATVGFITTNGLYTAPDTVGYHIIKAISNQNPTVIVTSGISVSTGFLEVQPAEGTVLEGQTRQFHINIGFDDPSVSWTINDMAGGHPAVGTIDASNLFHAPAFVYGMKRIKCQCRSNENPDVFFNVFLYIKSADLPTADFTASVVEGDAPLSVEFAAVATGTVNAWHWDFDEGATGSGAATTHVFSDPGLYTVTLNVAGPGGTAEKTKVAYIRANGGTAPLVDFRALWNPATFWNYAQFIPTTVGEVSSYAWDFAGLASDTAVQGRWDEPPYPGPHTIALTVTGPGGSRSKTKPDFLKVAGSYFTLDFLVYGSVSGTAPLTVEFVALPDPSACSYDWDFGDTSGGLRGPNPTHVYTEPGVYTVTLTSPIDEEGIGDICQDPNNPEIAIATKVDLIHVLPPPTLCNSNGDCADGTFCNGAEVCMGGECQAGGDPCPGQLCREGDDTCVECLSGADCDDEVYCNGAEACDANGDCQAGSNPCPGQLCRESDDLCVECLSAADCADDVFCNGAETCDANGECQPGGDPCPGALCRESDDLCVECLSAADCNDEVYCNGAEACDANGDCQAGGDPCPGQLCRESDDRCVECLSAADCTDGVFCNGAETCDANGDCQAGGDPCPGALCRESDDLCVECLSAADCDDSVFCNGAESCGPDGVCQAGTDPCPGQNCNESGDACVPFAEVWLAFNTATAVPGAGTVQNEDIVAYNLETATWSLIFDGSDVGLSSYTLGGMAVLPAGDILLSFTGSATIPGLVGGPSGTSVTASDIVRFVPTSLGATTAGTFYFYFDGSDVGLTNSNEALDAIALGADGRLVLSTYGAFSATGASGEDEDLIRFTATSLGSVTAGSFALYFDGSDVGLSTNADEDVDAAGLTTEGTLLFSTLGNFSVTGLSGADEDLGEFTATTWGSTTAGTYAMYLDLSTLGISTAADVSAMELVE